MSWHKEYKSRADFYADEPKPATDDTATSDHASSSSSSSVAGSIAPTPATNDTATSDHTSAPAPSNRDEECAQLHTAREAAKLIIEAGVVGGGELLVTLSGHANAGHVLTAGAAADQINISIVQQAAS